MGARFRDTLSREEKFAGAVEGRLQVGFRAKGIIYGVTGGYAQPFGLLVRSNMRDYVGGGVVGLFVDWR